MTEHDPSLAVPRKEGAKVFLDVLNANGVDCIFTMPGTDTFPVQEAIADYDSRGLPTPKVITCQHESMVVAAAHGYFMMTGRPQVGLVHVDVGTQMLGGLVSNAVRGRAGMVLCAGKTPADVEGRSRGARSIDVHWLQDRRDQAGIIRDSTKWNFDISRPEHFEHAMQRAFQIAGSQPSGPTYVTLLRESLMEEVDYRALPPERYGPLISPKPDFGALETVAKWLIKSERPLISTAYVGRDSATVEYVIELTDLLAIPLIERRERVNLPTNHPMHLGYEPQPLIDEADVILILDRDVPWVPRVARPPEGCRIAHIDIDVLKTDMPIWGFPVDLPIQADSQKALPQLIEIVREFLTDADRKRIADRRDRLIKLHNEQRSQWAKTARAESDLVPMSPAWVGYCVNEVLPEDAVVLDDAVTSSYVLRNYVESTNPHSFFKSGGASMGWGQGAAIGAKLAAPDRTIVVLDADGNFMDSSPLAPLWAADRYELPYLTVILNNSSYNAVRRSVLDGYPESKAAQRSDDFGIGLSKPPDFAAIAKACGGYGETVSDPAELRSALTRSLKAVKNGQAALVDVHTQVH